MNDSRPAQPPKPANSAAPLTAPPPGAVFNPYRLFRGAHVPMAVLSCADLSPGAKLCYGLMKDMAGRQGYCWPAVRSIAGKLGVVSRQVERYLRELETYGLIRSNPTPGKSSRYVFLWHAVFAEPSPTTPDRSVTTTPDRSVTQTPKGELLQLNSRSSSSPEQFPRKVLNGEPDTEKKRRRMATTTRTEGDSLPEADEYTDPREYLRALFLASTGAAIETKLDHDIRDTLELRGQDLAAFLADIRPRLLRLSQRAGPGFWYRQAREFHSFTTRPLPPEPPPPPEPPKPETVKCGTCGCSLGHGFVLRDGKPDYCPECEAWRAAHPHTAPVVTVTT